MEWGLEYKERLYGRHDGTFNPSPQKAKVGGSLEIQSQQGYTEWLCLKKYLKKNKKKEGGREEGEGGKEGRKWGAVETATLTEDLNLVFSTHVVNHKCL